MGNEAVVLPAGVLHKIVRANPRSSREATRPTGVAAMTALAVASSALPTGTGAGGSPGFGVS